MHFAATNGPDHLSELDDVLDPQLPERTQNRAATPFGLENAASQLGPVVGAGRTQPHARPPCTTSPTPQDSSEP